MAAEPKPVEKPVQSCPIFAAPAIMPMTGPTIYPDITFKPGPQAPAHASIMEMWLDFYNGDPAYCALIER